MQKVHLLVISYCIFQTLNKNSQPLRLLQIYQTGSLISAENPICSLSFRLFKSL